MAAASADEEADAVQLNGVVVNGHDDKPFRSVHHSSDHVNVSAFRLCYCVCVGVCVCVCVCV